MRVQVLAVEGAPEVPVARVEDAHAGPSVGLPAVPVTLPEGADTAGPGQWQWGHSLHQYKHANCPRNWGISKDPCDAMHGYRRLLRREGKELATLENVVIAHGVFYGDAMRTSLPALLASMPSREGAKTPLPNVASAGIDTGVTPDVPYVWPDVGLSADSEVAPNTILLVTAPGAMGKSAAAKNMAARLRTIYVDLAALRVGSGSLTGELTKALGFEAAAAFVSELKAGKAALVLDSTDEAQLKAGRENYLAFLDDLLWLLIDAVPANQVALLGRRDAMDTTLLALMDLGATPPLYHIEPLSMIQAHELIDLTLDRKVKDDVPFDLHRKHPEPFARLREALFKDLAQALDENLRGADSYWEPVADFLGYPPVLVALSERLAVDNPVAELASPTGENQRLLRGELLKNVVEQILDREQEKVRERLGDALGMAPGSAERNVLYTRDEQVSRLLRHVGTQGVTLNVPASLDDVDRSKYEENIESFVLDHPFLKDDKFTSVVFKDYVRAWAVASKISGLYSSDRSHFLSTLPTVGPFFSHFVHALSTDSAGTGQIPEDMINDAIHSYGLGTEEGNAYYVHQGETAFLFLESQPLLHGQLPQLTFGVTELSGVVTLRSPISRLTFMSHHGLVLLGSEGNIDIGPNVAIVATDLEIKAGVVTAMALSSTDERFFNMITAASVTHDPDVKVVALPHDSLSIAWPDPWYQWKDWALEFGSANPSLSRMTVNQVLLFLRRTFTSMRRNMQDDPSVSAEKMERTLVGTNPVFRATLAALQDIGVVSRTGTLFKVNLDALGEYGVSWSDLHGDDPIGTLKSIFEAVIQNRNFDSLKE